LVEACGDTGRVIAARRTVPGKVGIVVGGGSGHEPAFYGYVGPGLADAVAIGNVFASPSPVQILEATRAASQSAGVLYLYGNYSGDVMNFDMAAEQAADEDITVRTVLVTDDVASAPEDRRQERRGIAGGFFVFKVAAAAADQFESLEGTVRLAAKANGHTRTMGVALSPCSLPHTLKYNFELGADDMEIGMGIHGEAGIRRTRLASADAVTDELVEAILHNGFLSPGDEVALLVNGLGSTSLMELYLLNRRTRQILLDQGIGIHVTFVGEYVTSLEMAGASISIMKLDDELKRYLDHPCDTPALRIGNVSTLSTDSGSSSRRQTRRASSKGTAGNLSTHALNDAGQAGDISPTVFTAMMLGIADSMHEHRDWLSSLDGVIGDGDHGVTMDIGWTAVASTLKSLEPGHDIGSISRLVGNTFLDAVGASCGPLYASGFLNAAKLLGDRLALDNQGMVDFISAMAEGIQLRGKAEAGDKTMVDAWLPARDQARQALVTGADTETCLRAALSGAEQGREATAGMVAVRGRSSKLGDRSLGHIDPGAASACLMLSAILEAYLEPGDRPATVVTNKD
ncbi:MAG: dihydroxyacetone kinase subunit L, partial [Granulosicoccus sp.]|nr:dihydroxyacetone kinase subunit L [Granulosicoccus sp.]